MPIPSAIPVRTKDEHLAKQRSFKIAKVAIVSLLFLLLMYVGLQGAQHAKLLARLSDIALVRDQLQRKLDEDYSLTEKFLGGVPDTESARRLSLPNDRSRAMANNLKLRLDQFDSYYSPSKLAEVENLEIRLSKASLANFEHRFVDALEAITDNDAKEKPAKEAVQASLLVGVLRIRGDAFYGLRKWQEALDSYRQLLTLQSNRIATMRRVADCQYGLGRRDEALVTYGGLAKSHNTRGDALRLQGRLDAANGHYAKAAQIQTWLTEQERQRVAPAKAE